MKIIETSSSPIFFLAVSFLIQSERYREKKDRQTHTSLAFASRSKTLTNVPPGDDGTESDTWSRNSRCHPWESGNIRAKKGEKTRNYGEKVKNSET